MVITIRQSAKTNIGDKQTGICLHTNMSHTNMLRRKLSNQIKYSYCYIQYAYKKEKNGNSAATDKAMHLSDRRIHKVPR